MNMAIQNIGDTLCHAKIARRQHDDDTVIRAFINAGFAESGNLIHASIGA
jgi:hypothetical protein